MQACCCFHVRHIKVTRFEPLRSHTLNAIDTAPDWKLQTVHSQMRLTWVPNENFWKACRMSISLMI